MNNYWDVAVVGAGLAGISCADSLRRNGYRVVVLEKSRGLGGRLATRRVHSIPVDHGCRFLQPITPQLKDLIAAMEIQGVLAAWTPKVFQMCGDGTLRQSKLEAPLFVAPLGMTAVVKQLAQDLCIHRETRVVALRSEHRTWHMLTTSSRGQSEISALCVVLALPAPQIVNLLQSSETPHEQPLHLQTVNYSPCIAVMAGFRDDQAVGPTENESGWMIWGEQHSPLIWMGLDSGKPGRRGQTVVLHSNQEFAQAFLETDDLTEAANELLQSASPFLGRLAQPRWWQAHRWRYSTVNQPLEKRNLSDYTTPECQIKADAPLFCCGDWHRGGGTGAALTSGTEVAGAVNAYLSSY